MFLGLKRASAQIPGRKMKNLRTLAVLATISLALAPAVILDIVGAQCQQPENQIHIERTAIVSVVIDGDTISLESGEKVRFVGINTPETLTDPPEEGGPEAKEFLQNACPPGTEVGLNVDDLKPKDHYGRTLAVVYLRDGNSWKNLNAEILRRGLAEILFIPPSEFNPYKWV